MKISTKLLFERASNQMSSVQNKLADSQAQLAQGKQIVKPSDSPDQAAVVQRLKSLLSKQESFTNSLATVRARLENEDSTLKSATGLLVRAKEIAVQAGNDTLSKVNRQALGSELRGVRDQLLSLANTRDTNGTYLFSGSRSKYPPFAAKNIGETPIYRGDQTKMSIMVGEQRSIPINRTGSETFVSISRPGSTTAVGFFEVMDNLVDGINSSNGESIQRGIKEMTDLMNGLTLAHADIGTDMNVVDQQSSVIEDAVLNLKVTLSSVEDLDYASAITKMNQQMLSLEAAQSSFSKIAQLTLFNYLK